MTTTMPAGRLGLLEQAPRQWAALGRFDDSIQLDDALRELVCVRASQVNGCAFCIDAHWKEARALGESEERLYSLDAWRESPLYSERERAALELCEAVTLVTEGHVADAVWQRARDLFDDDELAQLVLAIVAINSWNRIGIATRLEPGHE